MKKRVVLASSLALVALGVFGVRSAWRRGTPQAYYHFYKGKRLYDQHKYREAMSEFRSAIIRKDSRDARYFLSQSLIQEKDYRNAAGTLNELLQHYPNDVPATLELGRIYLAAGRSDPELLNRARDKADEVLAHDKSNVDALLLAGSASTGLHAYDYALEIFQRATRIAPENIDVWIALGYARMSRGDNHVAEQTFLKARAIDSKNKAAISALLADYVAMNNTEKQESLIKEALRMDPADRDMRLRAVDFYTRANRFKEIEIILRDSQTRLKDDPSPALLLTDLYTSRNRAEDAQKLLIETRDKFPKSAEVALKIGQLEYAAGHTAEAEKSLTRAFELQPGSEQILDALTTLDVNNQQVERAIQRLSSISENKRQAFHYELLGVLFSRTGKLQDAEKAYQRALEKDPTRASASYYLFNDYVRAGRIEDAGRTLAAILERNPSDSKAYALRGALLERQGKIEEAKQSYAAALTIQPDSVVAANNLAYILADEGNDLQTALKYAQLVRQKSRESPGAADTLGWVYYKLGNFPDARNELEFAVAKEPDNADFQYHLGMIYKKTGQNEKAREALQKAGKASQ